MFLGDELGADVVSCRLECPQCGQWVADVGVEPGGVVRCPCGWETPVADGAIEESQITKCPLCSTDEMYLQKDFPERIGVLIVVVGAVLATIAWAMYSWVWTFGILFGTFIVDWILFHTRRNVTVCYRCLAQFRNMQENPRHQPFDLAIGERFRQERLRKNAARS